jgi:hypothetical protein
MNANIPPGMDDFSGPPTELPAYWRMRAEKLRAWGAAEAAALFGSVAQELEHVARGWEDELLTRSQAARECPKITADYVGKLQREGRLPDRGGGMVRRGDLRAYLLTGEVPSGAHLRAEGMGVREETRVLDRAAGARVHR